MSWTWINQCRLRFMLGLWTGIKRHESPPVAFCEGFTHEQFVQMSLCHGRKGRSTSRGTRKEGSDIAPLYPLPGFAQSSNVTPSFYLVRHTRRGNAHSGSLYQVPSTQLKAWARLVCGLIRMDITPTPSPQRSIWIHVVVKYTLWVDG